MNRGDALTCQQQTATHTKNSFITCDYLTDSPGYASILFDHQKEAFYGRDGKRYLNKICIKYFGVYYFFYVKQMQGNEFHIDVKFLLKFITI